MLRCNMTNYRRNLLAGGSFFFTVNLAERRLRLLTEHIDELRNALRQTRQHHPFTIDAIVVLPDARGLDAPGARPEFCQALAADQIGIFAQPSSRRADFRQSRRKANAVSGSGVIGSTPSAMRKILRVIWTTSISTRSSMGSCRGSATGRIRRSIVW
jgi:hypothetical protein